MARFVTILMACAVLNAAGCESSVPFEPMGDSGPDGGVLNGTPTTSEPWIPSIEDLGEPGWEESTEPICREEDGFGTNTILGETFDVWTDFRGVFLLFGQPQAGLLDILMNDGTGWRVVTNIENRDYLFGEKLTGFDGGDLINFSGNGHFNVLSSTDWAITTTNSSLAYDVFVVNENLAYGLLDSDNSLIWYDGTSWGPFPGEPIPYSARRIWANEDSIFIAGDDGLMVSYIDERWLVHDTGTLDSFMAIWGFADNDVWAGTYGGDLMHWDGTDWSRVEWPDAGDDSDDCHAAGQGILGMWGQSGILFFHTSTQLVRWDGAEFASISYWPGEHFVDENGIPHCNGSVHILEFWGRSPTELFFVVREGGQVRLCEEYLLYWDGSLFHWF